MRIPSVLIDANLLVLFVVGNADKRRIKSHNRLSRYTVESYHRLRDYVSIVQRLIVTPHLLAETSNLLGRADQESNQIFFDRFKSIITSSEIFEEAYVPSRDAMAHPTYRYLGLTDAGILALARRETAILSDDRKLVDAALRSNLRAGCLEDLPKGH